jgi:hypothetical protein
MDVLGLVSGLKKTRYYKPNKEQRHKVEESKRSWVSRSGDWGQWNGRRREPGMAAMEPLNMGISELDIGNDSQTPPPFD